MNESDPWPSDIDHTIRSFEIWHMDPRISAVLNRIREHNTRLASEPVDAQSVSAIVASLDSAWEEFIGEECRFTGRASFNYDHIEGNEGVNEYFEDDNMVFFGVKETIYDNAIRDSDGKTFYKLSVLFQREVIDADGKLGVARGVCDVDQIGDLEFDSLMSTERATEIVRALLPELFEAINSASERVDADDSPTVKIMALKNLFFDPATMIDVKSEKLLKRALDVYTNSLLTYDTVMPHLATIKGMVWSFNEENLAAPAMVGGGKALAIVHHVSWEQSPEDGGSRYLPSLDIVYARGSEISALGHMCVPLSALFDLDSIRHQFFGRKK